LGSVPSTRPPQPHGNAAEDKDEKEGGTGKAKREARRGGEMGIRQGKARRIYDDIDMQQLARRVGR
jgi:hypothetical protein